MNGLAPPRTRFIWQRPIKRPWYEPSGGTVVTTSVVHTRGFGVPIVSMGAQFVTTVSVVHTRAFGVPKLNRILYTQSVVHVRAFGVPRIDRSIKPTGVVHSRAFGTPAVSRGSVTVTTTSVVHTRAFGNTNVKADTNIYCVSVIHQRAFGTPYVGPPRVNPDVIQTLVAMQEEWLISQFEQNQRQRV